MNDEMNITESGYMDENDNLTDDEQDTENAYNLEQKKKQQKSIPNPLQHINSYPPIQENDLSKWDNKFVYIRSSAKARRHNGRPDVKQGDPLYLHAEPDVVTYDTKSKATKFFILNNAIIIAEGQNGENELLAYKYNDLSKDNQPVFVSELGSRQNLSFGMTGDRIHSANNSRYTLGALDASPMLTPGTPVYMLKTFSDKLDSQRWTIESADIVTETFVAVKDSFSLLNLIIFILIVFCLYKIMKNIIYSRGGVIVDEDALWGGNEYPNVYHSYDFID